MNISLIIYLVFRLRMQILLLSELKIIAMRQPDFLHCSMPNFLAYAMSVTAQQQKASSITLSIKDELLSHSLYHLLRRVGHRIAGDESQAGVGQRLSAGSDVVAFEPDDERKLQTGFFHRRHDASGDDVAVHDAAENVHEDALHVRVLHDDFECGRDLLLAGATAHVEKIRLSKSDVRMNMPMS